MERGICSKSDGIRSCRQCIRRSGSGDLDRRRNKSPEPLPIHRKLRSEFGRYVREIVQLRNQKRTVSGAEEEL